MQKYALLLEQHTFLRRYNANVFVCGTCRSVNRIHRYGNGERRLSTVEPTPNNEVLLFCLYKGDE